MGERGGAGDKFNSRFIELIDSTISSCLIIPLQGDGCVYLFYIFRFKRVSDLPIIFNIPFQMCAALSVAFSICDSFSLDAAVECTIPRNNIERIYGKYYYYYRTRATFELFVCFFFSFSCNKRIPCLLNITQNKFDISEWNFWSCIKSA